RAGPPGDPGSTSRSPPVRQADHLSIGLVLGPLRDHWHADDDIVGIAEEITHDADVGLLVESHQHHGVGHRRSQARAGRIMNDRVAVDGASWSQLLRVEGGSTAAVAKLFRWMLKQVAVGAVLYRKGAGGKPGPVVRRQLGKYVGLHGHPFPRSTALPGA